MSTYMLTTKMLSKHFSFIITIFNITKHRPLSFCIFILYLFICTLKLGQSSFIKETKQALFFLNDSANHQRKVDHI